MPIPKVHFLNVSEGDCILLERPSDRLTVIDICCGNLSKEELQKAKVEEFAAARPRGDYGMRTKPTNPIRYLEDRSMNEIWRFILTHPDMDHMDGIKALFETLRVVNFWDCGIRKEKPEFENGCRYKEEDWDFYADLIANRVAGTNIITPRAGAKGKYWNADDDQKNGNGDYLSILSPSKELVSDVNNNGDINDASYVIVYHSSAGPIVFPGDSTDKTWEYIMENHSSSVTNAAIMFAPHHGRKADQDFSFLDVVKPRITFFGCASSGHLAYSAWRDRDLLYFTNNQCGNVHIYPNKNNVDVFIENRTFAVDYTKDQTYSKDGHWFLCSR